MGITKVTLREKPLKDKKRATLYLDFYPAVLHPQKKKLTRREFLGIYVHANPTTALEKDHNRAQREIAELIRQRRQAEVNRLEIYSEWEREQIIFNEKQSSSFNEFFRRIVETKAGSNYSNWKMCLTYFENIFGQFVCFRDTDVALCNKFRSELLKMNSIKVKKEEIRISQNTAQSYYNKFRSVLKQAYREGYLRQDIRVSMETIKTQDTRKEYLTIDELNKLASTPVENDLLRRAALFSALTGLRFCDIRDLKWENIEFYPEHGWSLRFRQNKTSALEYIPISDQAFELLGKKGASGARVFEGLTYSETLNNALRKWVANAGIDKKITWHCFRHTYATIQLSKGTGISEVSKMLGHKSLVMTQIYAKVTDAAKREATNKIILKTTKPAGHES